MNHHQHEELTQLVERLQQIWEVAVCFVAGAAIVLACVAIAHLVYP